MPLNFATLDAIVRYRQSVRDTAPCLSSNVEFMRLIDPLVIIEAMKMEITVADTVQAIHCKPSRPVSVDDPLLVITVAE